ncbi:MAG: hypothetical protein Ct9H300mP31_04230 [Acidimicrobiaceae bacterium]|nr:MAG: hypothetical protein Ct9H300mP31_04230 [Acidimicrobiaceae bacterium]
MTALARSACWPQQEAGARKTVTFGGASEVKGSPSWSIAR